MGTNVTLLLKFRIPFCFRLIEDLMSLIMWHHRDAIRVSNNPITRLNNYSAHSNGNSVVPRPIAVRTSRRHTACIHWKAKFGDFIGISNRTVDHEANTALTLSTFGYEFTNERPICHALAVNHKNITVSQI